MKDGGSRLIDEYGLLHSPLRQVWLLCWQCHTFPVYCVVGTHCMVRNIGLMDFTYWFTLSWSCELYPLQLFQVHLVLLLSLSEPHACLPNVNLFLGCLLFFGCMRSSRRVLRGFSIIATPCLFRTRPAALLQRPHLHMVMLIFPSTCQPSVVVKKLWCWWLSSLKLSSLKHVSW